MSKSQSHTLTCPQCKQSQEVIVWDSLNIDADSELRDKLFNGEINIFDCKSCNYKRFINKPLLYHDTTRRYCVQYYPPELIDDNNFYATFTMDGKVTIEGIPDGHYLTEPHIVFNVNEMLMYIAFRDKLYENYQHTNVTH